MARRTLALASALALAGLACSLGGGADLPATETAIAAQVMTQLAPAQTPNSQLQTPSPPTATLSLPTSDFILPTSDFSPCSGYGTDPSGNAPGGYGPWASRLLIAFSDDGLTFTRADRILADQADVPDAITTEDGEVRVYFVIICPEEVYNKIVVAVSRDNAATWAYKKITLAGTEGLIPFAVDPTVERTLDGKWRLYFTSAPAETGGGGAGGAPLPGRSYSAISDDGYTFTREDGVRFEVEGQATLDVNVLLIGDTWHYFAGGGPPGANYHATSPDGLDFARADDFGVENIIMANGLAVDGGYRYYGFVQQGDGSFHIRSLFTTDGVNWSVDPGNRLELDTSTGLESIGVKDPGVTRLADGRYLMIYSTTIPGYPTPAPGGQPGGQPTGQPPPSLTQLSPLGTLPPLPQVTLPSLPAPPTP